MGLEILSVIFSPERRKDYLSQCDSQTLAFISLSYETADCRDHPRVWFSRCEVGPGDLHLQEDLRDSLMLLAPRSCFDKYWPKQVGKIPWRREQQPTPLFLSEESHGQRSLAGYSPWGQEELKHSWATNTFIFTFSLSKDDLQFGC